MKKDKIEFWIDKKDETSHFPSMELLKRLKNIPNEKNIVKQTISPWILWVAAASFIGFMLFNLSYLKSNSSNQNSLDSYFPTSLTY
jgi:magnesium-transporting ATPase (P-type)